MRPGKPSHFLRRGSPCTIQSIVVRNLLAKARSTSSPGATSPRSILESCPWLIPSSTASSSCRTSPRSLRTRHPMDFRSGLILVCGSISTLDFLYIPIRIFA
jgi:hypothetical protein